MLRFQNVLKLLEQHLGMVVTQLVKRLWSVVRIQNI